MSKGCGYIYFGAKPNILTMPGWSADRELEVACRVGSLPDFERAVEEGADLNFDGGAPLFLAIFGHHRHLVERLVAGGADVSLFLTKAKLEKLKSPQQIVDALMEGAPPPVADDDDEPPPADDDDDDF